MHENPVGPGLAGDRGIPGIADCKFSSQGRESWKIGGSKAPHDLMGCWERVVIAIGIVRHKGHVWSDGRQRGRLRPTFVDRVNLIQHVGRPVTRVDLQIQITCVTRYRYPSDRIRGILGVPLCAVETIQRRNLGFHEAQHVVERSVLQHQYDNVLNVSQGIYPARFLSFG